MAKKKLSSDMGEHLQELQSLELDAKIKLSNRIIKEWYEHWDGQVYVSFSGGKDSTVLLHLVRQIYPDVPAVFTDTGLEFPEILDFVKTVENVERLKPTMHFKEVLEGYGYPVVSKRIAGYVHGINHARSGSNTKRLRLEGIRKDGTFSPMSMISKKWRRLCNAPFQVSDKCCEILKMRPTRAYEKKTGRKTYIGTMAAEGSNRRSLYHKHGCNAFNLTRPRSSPLSFWREADIWDYIRRFNVPYSSIYDKGYSRTGCMFCMFGVHREKSPNRFQQMAQTHPKQYKYFMEKLGLAEVLDFIGVSYEPVLAE